MAGQPQYSFGWPGSLLGGLGPLGSLTPGALRYMRADSETNLRKIAKKFSGEIPKKRL